MQVQQHIGDSVTFDVHDPKPVHRPCGLKKLTLMIMAQ